MPRPVSGFSAMAVIDNPFRRLSVLPSNFDSSVSMAGFVSPASDCFSSLFCGSLCPSDSVESVAVSKSGKAPYSGSLSAKSPFSEMAPPLVFGWSSAAAGCSTGSVFVRCFLALKILSQQEQRAWPLAARSCISWISNRVLQCGQRVCNAVGFLLSLDRMHLMPTQASRECKPHLPG